MTELRFTVYGIPIPKGSMKAFMPRNARFPIVTNDNKKTKPWQAMICAAAMEARGETPPFEGPVWLNVVFYLPKPKSTPKYVLFPVKKPDLDKLVRSLKDGMTAAGVYADDSQVVHVEAAKRFSSGATDSLGTAGIPRAEVIVRDGCSLNLPQQAFSLFAMS